MKLYELLNALSTFDPECEVFAVTSETEYGYDEDFGSIEQEVPMYYRDFDIAQRPDGTVLIGYAEDYHYSCNEDYESENTEKIKI